MKVTNEMPKEGQFVAVWMYDDRVWSGVHQWIDGELMRYDVDDWLNASCDIDFYNSAGTKYITEA